MKLQSLSIAATLAALAAGCASQPEQEEEIATGKADGEGLQPGLYSALEPETNDPAFLLLTESNDVSGYHGYFDLSVVAADNYDSDYTTGYYKAYRYDGQLRVRLNAPDGTLLRRYTWDYADGVLQLSDDHGKTELYRDPDGPSSALVECNAVKVRDFGVFEEGLSVVEYPAVTVTENQFGALEAQFGSNGFSSDSAKISFAQATDHSSTTTVDVGGGTKYVLSVSGAAPRRGTISSVDSAGTSSIIADVICPPELTR